MSTLRPSEFSFDGWRELYFTSPSSETRAEALDNMVLTAQYSEDWSELFRIATEEEGLYPGHEFSRICSNGIGMASHKPTSYSLDFWEKLQNQFKHFQLWTNDPRVNILGKTSDIFQKSWYCNDSTIFYLQMITYHLITLFPESAESYLNASILKRAQEKGLIAIKYYNPRDFTVSARKDGVQTYSERRVDNRPYGGGPGMVIEALPVIKAIEAALSCVIPVNTGIQDRKIESSSNIISKSKKTSSNPKPKTSSFKIVFFSPSGKQFTNEVAEKFKKYTDIIFVCGRYEGIDARVKKAFPMVDISVGPYVVTGGELPAMIMIDTITRRIPGVLGDIVSLEEERVASPDVYTRPEVIEYNGKKLRVPKILLSGHHANLEKWRGKKKNKK